MYNAIVVRLENVRKHPNADRLQLANVFGLQVIVGLGAREGDIGVFFDTDGQLSKEYTEANEFAYFGKNRRVRAQNFRGEKSDGFWTELSTLEFTGYDCSILKEGDKFDTLAGVPICNKFITFKTKSVAGNKKQRKNYPFFPKHKDTDQFRFYGKDISYGAFLTITEKLHGTSGRSGWVNQPLEIPKWKQAIAKLFHIGVAENAYKYFFGSRNVTFDPDDFTEDGFYGDAKFRLLAHEIVKPHIQKDEVWYYEIVGYTDTGSRIMSDHEVEKIEDKKLRKAVKHKYKVKTRIHYLYGCLPATFKIYVYRIVTVTGSGHVHEFSWDQIQYRCIKAGINYVPEIEITNMYEGDFEELKDSVNYAVNGEDGLGHYSKEVSNFREGVVIRVDTGQSTYWLKEKSYIFKVLEGIMKDDDNFVDMEESS